MFYSLKISFKLHLFLVMLIGGLKNKICALSVNLNQNKLKKEVTDSFLKNIFWQKEISDIYFSDKKKQNSHLLLFVRKQIEKPVSYFFIQKIFSKLPTQKKFFQAKKIKFWPKESIFAKKSKFIKMSVTSFCQKRADLSLVKISHRYKIPFLRVLWRNVT